MKIAGGEMTRPVHELDACLAADALDVLPAGRPGPGVELDEGALCRCAVG
ncbi:MAG: hypothetical protein H0V20_03765 [Actinobacteria bacterium]|nr:hypothetical protein [Actinomycetota bacterium]